LVYFSSSFTRPPARVCLPLTGVSFAGGCIRLRSVGFQANLSLGNVGPRNGRRPAEAQHCGHKLDLVCERLGGSSRAVENMLDYDVLGCFPEMLAGRDGMLARRDFARTPDLMIPEEKSATLPPMPPPFQSLMDTHLLPCNHIGSYRIRLCHLTCCLRRWLS
jgi:hypothetical protein